MRSATWALLIAVLLAAPAAAEQPPIPQLALWEAHMLSYGQTHCDYLAGAHTFDEKLNSVYYDAERVFLQILDYTGNAAWLTCAQRAETIYRDQYVLPNNGNVPGYWNFTHGLAMDYARSSDVTSKNAVIALSQNAGYAGDTIPLEWTASAWRSREVAYTLMSYLNAEKVGAATRARRAQIVDQALDHIDQWFISKSFRCPSDCDPAAAAGQYYIQPFMVGLTAEALIMYFDKTADPRVLPAVRTSLDWLWANAWVPAQQAFWYDNWSPTPATPMPARAGAPDLNLLIAPAFAWLYTQTGDTAYRDRADLIFAGGVLNAYLGGGKQFNQNYKWSFDYVRWRRGAEAAPPTVALTAPADGATVAGTVSVAATASDGVAGVQFKLDGVNLGSEVTAAPYTVAWVTAGTANGAHTLTAVARDAAGNLTTSGAVAVTVLNDRTAPTVALTAPAGGTVSGTVAVTAAASDDVAVAGVQFKLDGANLSSEVTAPPYTVAWTTTTSSNAAHTLTAVARDAAGNRTTSAAVGVTVSNDKTAPTVAITAPLAGTVA
ncbi:MAG TPA: Ig-like domain-containing protein, partial [Methylomirabilota bacterium]|nr:Ig-like domain-containing protein [Methylomirabilota bacterium]